jgi:magnesium chelatase family protein
VPGFVQKYLSRISGPLLDRIDIHIEVVPVPFDKLSEQRVSEPSNVIRERVMAARNIQKNRFADYPGIHCNAQMNSKMLRKYCVINAAGYNILKAAMQKLGLSARAYDRIIKVSRTIADMEASPEIQVHHLAEAIQYRSLDREGWGS